MSDIFARAAALDLAGPQQQQQQLTPQDYAALFRQPLLFGLPGGPGGGPIPEGAPPGVQLMGSPEGWGFNPGQRGGPGIPPVQLMYRYPVQF